MDNGVIPKLVEFLKTPTHRDVVLRLLYHLSIDDKCKSMFTYTDAIPLVCVPVAICLCHVACECILVVDCSCQVLQLVIQFPGESVQRELIALAVNLTANQRNAEIMYAARPPLCSFSYILGVNMGYMS